VKNCFFFAGFSARLHVAYTQNSSPLFTNLPVFLPYKHTAEATENKPRIQRQNNPIFAKNLRFLDKKSRGESYFASAGVT